MAGPGESSGGEESARRQGPSRTAAYVTLFRAIESRRAPERRLFFDPYAEAFLDARLRRALELSRLPLAGRAVNAYIDRRSPGARTAVLVRTRYIDEATGAALAAGAGQVVILGSGYDARPYRLEALRGARVFEVDEPATLAAKRALIAARLGAVPAGVAMVEIDFERDDLAERLGAAGFDPTGLTFFIWEGVTGYLSPEAVDGTLRTLAGLGAPGSRVVFTYLEAGLLGGGSDPDQLGARGTVEAVRQAGEPFRFGLDSEELPAYLAERGFELIEQVSSAELAARYLHPLGRRPPASPFFRIALARSAG
ncbi:MAG: SAM-dependent methyltransferase [Solirubrobacterales bacterium]